MNDVYFNKSHLYDKHNNTHMYATYIMCCIPPTTQKCRNWKPHFKSQHIHCQQDYTPGYTIYVYKKQLCLQVRMGKVAG